MNNPESQTEVQSLNQSEASTLEKNTFDKESAYIDSAHLETQESPEKEGQEEETKVQEKETINTSQEDKEAKGKNAKKDKQKNQEIPKEEILDEEIEGEILRPDQYEEDDEEEKLDENEYEGMDRLDIPKYEKELGRNAFSEGKYEEAVKHYSKAILGTNFLFKDQMVPTEEKARELLHEVSIPCYLNNALCYIKLKAWKLAIENANAALTLDEDNVKALYRKAVANFNLGDLTTTSDCIKRALEIEPNDASIRALAMDLKERRKQIYDKEKKMGQKMVEELTKSNEVKLTENITEVEKPENKLAKLKKKVVEPIVTRQKEVVKQVKTWRDQVKLLILLPLNLMSEICCRRRLPSQFYQLQKKED